jgi:flagellar basal body-associated protein FliL
MLRRNLVALLALASLAPAAARAAEEKGKKSGGGDAKKKSGGENYIPINPITGTTNKPGGRRGVLSVDCGLEIEDPKLKAYAELALPRLRAAYVQTIQVYAAGLPPNSEPSVEFIVQALQRQTDLILKRPGARFLVGAVVAN